MGIIGNIKGLWKSLKRKFPNPVHECIKYKQKGCCFVDGPFCDFPKCQINKDFVEDAFKNNGIELKEGNGNNNK